MDYLHLLLSAVSWLLSERGVRGRFVISLHDEVRYLVREEQAMEAAEALHVANMLVRSMFCAR